MSRGAVVRRSRRTCGVVPAEDPGVFQAFITDVDPDPKQREDASRRPALNFARKRADTVEAVNGSDVLRSACRAGSRRFELDARPARSMQNSPLFGEPSAWADIVDRSLEDYRSGRSLMDHLGADRLIDPPLTGMLLAIRRGPIEEMNAASMADYALMVT